MLLSDKRWIFTSQFLFLIIFFFALTGCADSPRDSSAPSTLQILEEVNYWLPQPVLMRDNLPNERGNHRLDSLQWQLLSMQGLVPYSPHSGFFILGKIENTPGTYTSLLLYEENAANYRAWIANYNSTGAILDYRLVFHQKADGKVSQSAYLEDNVLEIKKATSHKIYYRLLPSGQFTAL